jgi:hypothetical protein
MFTTVQNTLKVTGYEVDNALIGRAQGLIEAFVGRNESDVDNPRDIAILSLATSYQAAYMRDNADSIFEQIPVSMESVAGSTVTFRAGDTASPFISGPAQLACRKLSWRRSHSVHTGKVFQGKFAGDWWTD